ncbi:MAG: oxygen-dependent coproporphyrinogen oxidase [Myxococcales bacterium]|nr:oxygen-dependent coproporphyrinogen oxidase [Myxococcales bacterium]
MGTLQRDGGSRPEAVRDYLDGLQNRICAALESQDGGARFREQLLDGPGGALSRPRVLEDGTVFEKAAVHFTHARAPALPPAATDRRPELAGAPFEAISVSLIVHPRNPYIPTSHANFRFFQANPAEGDPVWWFGGGFDLTPFYGFEEDCVHWHRVARECCAPLGPGSYARLKKWCDEYFFLAHRQEARGIGGLFFDDLSEGGFERCFEFVQRAGDGYLAAYLPLVELRRDTPFGERERQFQLLRRGRYVEFNLLYDRGTKYGIQSGRRIENVLASMPPLVQWRYDWQPEAGSAEAELADRFLQPREWVPLDD